MYIFVLVCLFVCLCFTSFQQRGHLETAHMSLARDVTLGKYTVPTENPTPGRRVAVHYATVESKHIVVCDGSQKTRFFSHDWP